MNLFKQHSPLEKYIAEVRTFLPRKSRDDIADELKANIEEKINELQEVSGEEMKDAAIIKLLSEYGHPFRVAAQYQGSGRSLIGPDFYPYFRTSIIASLSISTAILLLLLAVDLFFALDIGDVSRVWMFVNTYIYIIGITTGGFITTQWIIERNNYLDSWSPSSAAPPRQAVATAWGAIFSVVATITWLVILNMVNLDHSITVLFGQTGNPFHTLVLWMKIQLLFLIPQYFYLIFNQVWTWSRLGLRIGTELILLAGCIVTLTMDTEGFRNSYPGLPASLFSTFTFVVWAFIVAIVISILIYWRKATASFANSESEESAQP